MKLSGGSSIISSIFVTGISEPRAPIQAKASETDHEALDSGTSFPTRIFEDVLSSVSFFLDKKLKFTYFPFCVISNLVLLANQSPTSSSDMSSGNFSIAINKL